MRAPWIWFPMAVALCCWNMLEESGVGQDLPRRISLGTHVQPLSEEARQKNRLRNNRGVEVRATVPDSTAAKAGVIPGDILLALNEMTFLDLSDFVDTVNSIRGKEELRIRLQREGKEVLLRTTSQPLPLETSDDFDIEYSMVKTKNGRLRTVLTLPKGKGPFKAFLLLSGLGNGPAEHPSMDPLGMKGIAHEMTRNGFAVLRVDKPGCGDSEGGPSKDAEFSSVVEGYVEGLRHLKQHPKVQPSKVMLAGFSIGGVQAPLIAREEPVAGIAVYGTMSFHWKDYILNTTRRQAQMSGIPENDLKSLLAQEAKAWDLLLGQQLSPDEIANKDDSLVDWVDKNWIDGKYFSGIHYRYFQQLGKADVAGGWQSFDGPVLAMWGEFDFIAGEEDHKKIVELIQREHPGKAQYQKIDGHDHQLMAVRSIEQAITRAGSPSPVIAQTIAHWAKAIP